MKGHIRETLRKQIGMYSSFLSVFSTAHSDHVVETLSGKKCARLEFEHYEKKIVERLGVVIDGWTCPDFVSPSHFKKIAQVEELFNAVNSGDCKVRKLSDDELAARKLSNQTRHALGEAVYGTPKDTAAGVKRKATGDGTEAGEGNVVNQLYSNSSPTTSHHHIL